MPPTVSVVIPTYNRAHLIIETLESVFAQTYTDYEVIVVDDGSTDNTEEVLAPYRDRIRYIKQKNAGASVARNRGIVSAQGEYVTFLDSDDIWFPEKLEKQVRFFEQHNHCSFLCGAFCNTSQEPQKKISLYPSTTKMEFKDFVSVGYIATSSIMIKKDVFLTSGLFDPMYQIGEDRDLWIRISYCFECWYLDELFCNVRDHADSITKDYAKKIDDFRRHEVHSLRFRDIPEVSEEYRQKAANGYADYFYYFRVNGEYAKAAECCRLAATYSTSTVRKCILTCKYVILRFFPFVFRFYDSFKKTG